MGGVRRVGAIFMLALLSPSALASSYRFELHDLVVPPQATAGVPFTVAFTMENPHPVSGTANARIIVDGLIATEANATLGANESIVIERDLSLDAGAHSILVRIGDHGIGPLIVNVSAPMVEGSSPSPSPTQSDPSAAGREDAAPETSAATPLPSWPQAETPGAGPPPADRDVPVSFALLALTFAVVARVARGRR